MNIKNIAVILFLTYSCLINAETVVEDNGISIDKRELENAIKYIPDSMKIIAIEDESARIDIMAQILENKKIAKEANLITIDMDEEFYWQKEFAIRKLSVELFLRRFENKLQIPDMTELSAELYKVNKESLAKVAERRGSSHILFKCSPGSKTCDRAVLRKTVEKVHAALKDGASFEEMVDKYSGDPSSKARKGKLESMYARGDAHVNGHFLAGLFSIKEVGEISGIIETRFGFHIIRLDKLIPKSYKTYDEVKPKIIEALIGKYKKLALADYFKSFEMGSDVVINKPEIDKLFKSLESSMNKEK